MVSVCRNDAGSLPGEHLGLLPGGGTHHALPVPLTGPSRLPGLEERAHGNIHRSTRRQ